MALHGVCRHIKSGTEVNGLTTQNMMFIVTRSLATYMQTAKVM